MVFFEGWVMCLGFFVFAFAFFLSVCVGFCLVDLLSVGFFFNATNLCASSCSFQRDVPGSLARVSCPSSDPKLDELP